MSVRTRPQLALPMPLRTLPLTPATVAQRRRQAKELDAAGAPIGGLADPRFKYVGWLSTDISKTFERAKRELRKEVA